jgi:hypothetical protein
MNEGGNNVLLIKLYVQCVERSLLVLSISSWNGGIDTIMKENILPYSKAIIHLLTFCSRLIPKSSAGQLHIPIVHDFCEALNKLLESWMAAINQRKVKLSEVLLLSEKMDFLKDMCELLGNKQLSDDIELQNEEIFNMFITTFSNLRDEVLPLITVIRNCESDDFTRLVSSM